MIFKLKYYVLFPFLLFICFLSGILQGDLSNNPGDVIQLLRTQVDGHSDSNSNMCRLAHLSVHLHTQLLTHYWLKYQTEW